MLNSRGSPAPFAGLCGLQALFLGAAFAAVAANSTGLPTYPNVSTASMDAVVRSAPWGARCVHYAAESPDALEKVESWYRKAFAGSVEDDVNHNSPYGGYFKLTGVKLTRGNDVITVYAMPNQKTTSIEIFKCSAVAK